MKTAIYRKEHFNAAHRLNNPDWSAGKNAHVFGKCNNDNFHGHNYELIVKLIGEVDQETGYLCDLKTLKNIIRDKIISRFDHKNLNKDVEEFQSLNPTAENIARVIWNILRENVDIKLDLKVILYETERNFVEYPA